MSQDKKMPKGKKTSTDSKPASNKYGSRGTGSKSVAKKGQSKVQQGKGKKVVEKPIKVDFQKAVVKDSEKLLLPL